MDITTTTSSDDVAKYIDNQFQILSSSKVSVHTKIRLLCISFADNDINSEGDVNMVTKTFKKMFETKANHLQLKEKKYNRSMLLGLLVPSLLVGKLLNQINAFV